MRNAFTLTALLAAPAYADPAATASAPPKEHALLVAARVGALIPSAFNRLQATFVVDLELGYQLPFLHRRLGLFLGASYSQPTASGTVSTPQLASGMATYDLTQRDTGVTLGAQYLHRIGRRFHLHGGVGARFHFTRSIVKAAAGAASLGENSEDSSRLGFLARLGAGFHVGPGAIGLLVHYEYVPVNHLVTGDDNSANVAVQVGWTFFLL